MLADYAVAVEGKLHVNGAGITRLTPPEVPFFLPLLSLVARWRLDGREDAGKHELTLRFQTPDGTDLIPSEPVPIEQRDPYATALPGEEVFMQLVFNFGAILLPVEGIYRFSVQLDGEVVRDMALPVVVTKSPPPPNRAERRRQERSRGH